MSITITGGISFSGAVSIVAQPPPPILPSTAGWFIGGRPPVDYSGVDRVTYATDTATASIRGPLSKGTRAASSAGTNNAGWIVGGSGPGVNWTQVERITYATDTATATVRSTMSLANYGQSAVSDYRDYGWFAGGRNPGSPSISLVLRITYASDTDSPSTRGPLSASKTYAAGAGNETYGWIASGDNSGGGGGINSVVTRITYASDTDTSTARGNLNRSAYFIAGNGDNNYGWFGGGNVGGSVGVSLVSRITYATDTATASARGPLSQAKFGLTASTDNTAYVWFGAGNLGAPASFVRVSTVDRIEYATDTATASVRGPLNASVYLITSTSGVQ